MTVYTWSQLRTQAIELFDGQTPGGQLEHDIVQHFQEHPQAVAAAIKRIGERFAVGTVTSPWGMLRADLNRRMAGGEVTATDTTDRERAIVRAEQWVKAAGCHFDRASEVEHELFGDARLHPTEYAPTGEMIISSSDGLLSAWGDDLVLRQRMIDVWQSERPRGVRAEADLEARAAKYRDDQQMAREARRAAVAELDQAQAQPLVEILDPEPDPFANQPSGVPA